MSPASTPAGPGPAPGRLDHPEPTVNVIGDFLSSTGLAEAARRSVLALLSAGVGVNVVDVDLDAPKSANRQTPEIAALPRRRDAVIDIHFENTNEFSRLPDDVVRPPGHRSYAIASWYWELPELPWDFMPGLERVDEVWVASEYVGHVFARVTDKPVTVVGAVVEGSSRAEHDRAYFGLPERSCLFFYNFDAASSYARKNPMGFIRAFERAFTRQERGRSATLVLKSMRLDWFPELEQALRAAVARVDGILLTEDLSGEEMTSLLNCVDVYVSLHRSEGFGLGMAEAMRLGKPVICTAYSANVDFATLDNCRQVGFRLVPITDEDHRYHKAMTGLYRAGQLWADPDLGQAARWMRDLYEHPRERARLGAAASRTIRESFSRQAVGRRARGRLGEIVAQL